MNNNDCGDDVEDSGGMSAVQRQLAEYRKSMRQKQSPSAANNSNNNKHSSSANINTTSSQEQRLLPPSSNSSNRVSSYRQEDDLELSREASDKDIMGLVYEPPRVGGDDMSKLLIETGEEENYDCKDTQPKDNSTHNYNAMLTSTTSHASVVCINDLPMLNVFDLTRRSSNARLIRSGKGAAIGDLESQIVPDSGLKEVDIALIEKEVNKKK